MQNVSDKRDVLDEIVDIEKYTIEGRRVPDRCRGYQINVNGQRHIVDQPVITREEVARIADVGPVEQVCVRVHIRGARPQTHVLQIGEEVDLTTAGIEYFRVDEKCTVDVEINNKSIQLTLPTTGEGIKRTAIAAGVRIELDFVLYREQKDGQDDQIDDAEVVFADEGDQFSALAPDDNS